MTKRKPKKTEKQTALIEMYEKLDTCWAEFQESRNTPDAEEHLARLVGVIAMTLGIYWNEYPSEVLARLGMMMLAAEVASAGVEELFGQMEDRMN